MIEASCHCGSVTVAIPRKPRTLTACNCSICRRYATLWAYYPAARVRVRSPRGGLSSYAWGERGIRFMRCRRCGCVTHWEAARNPRKRRMGVNTRNVDPEVLKGVRVRHLDGASTWKFLD
jgi:hypothetical protein